MSPQRRCCCLLAVLSVLARCAADQQQPAADQQRPAADPPGRPTDALDQLLAAVSQAVWSANEPLTSRLDSQQAQLDAIVSRLDGQQAQLDAITSSLDSQQSQLDSIVSGLASQKLQLDQLVTSLNSHTFRLDSLNSRLDSRLDSLSTRLDSWLDSVNSRLDRLSVGQDSDQTGLDSAPAAPRDCSDLPAGAGSGVHLLQPGPGRSEPPVAAYCDLATDGGGWTVLQRRADIQPRQTFYLGWAAYKEGFGELDAEFWWGFDHIWDMVSRRDRRYELRVDLEDFDGGKRHAVYQGFRISSEADGYRLTAVNYTGDAGNSLSYQVGQKFSTKDKDQDTWDRHCARERKGAWWYGSCHMSNLNGEYLSGVTASNVYGVNWHGWRGPHYSLKTVEMKIRPTLKSDLDSASETNA